MAKIKINKLPKGFELVDGKIQETKSMQDGGMTTGDQANYGLVTTPQAFYGSTNFNNSRDESVRFSLSSVPRDNANVEAEGGETVLTDLNDDGQFGLYDINGPRHSKGGVPMFLPEQSFIFSDTPKLKFGKEEMAELDMGGDRKTPAKISKKFQLNDYYGELGSQYADNISSLSAELMLKKNMSDLSKLAFMQESKKSFADGVPLAAHPYLVSIGEDPIEFTAKVEQISQQQAEQQTMAALPAEQQQQIMMLQQFMQQAQQQEGNPQGNVGPREQMAMQAAPGSFEQMELADDNSDLMLNAKYGGNLTSYQKGGQKASDFAKEKGQQWPEGAQDPTWNGSNWEFDDGREMGMMDALRMANKVKGGAPIPEEYKIGYDPAAVEEVATEEVVTEEVVTEDSEVASGPTNETETVTETVTEEVDLEEGDDTADGTFTNPYKGIPGQEENAAKLEQYRKDGYELSVVDGKIRAYLPYQSKFSDESKVVVQDIEGIGTGETTIISEDNQAQGAVLDASPIGSYRPGIYSGGNRPEKQGVIYQNQIVDGVYDPNIDPDTSTPVYAYGSDKLKSAEGEADFMNRWGDVTSQIEGFDYSKPGNDPQWKEFQILAEETRKKEAKELGIPYVAHFKKKGDEGYEQGQDYDGALGLHTFNTPRLDVDFTSSDEQFMDLPVETPGTDPVPDPVPTPPAEAEWWKQDENNLNTLMGIKDELFLPWAPELEDQKIDYVLDDYTGRVNANNASLNTMSDALKAYGPQALARSNVFGKTLDANAKAINQVNSNNVKTMNQVATLQPQLDMKVDMANAAKDTKLYDDTTVSLQNAQNFSNWKTAKANELYNTGITNAANTANMNDLYNYYDINPQKAGRVEWGENGRDLYKDSQKPRVEDFKDFYTDIQGQFPDQELNMTDALKVWSTMNSGPTNNSNITEQQNEAANNGLTGYPGSNVQITRKGKQGGEQVKKWAMPFYSGKMGV